MVGEWCEGGEPLGEGGVVMGDAGGRVGEREGE